MDLYYLSDYDQSLCPLLWFWLGYSIVSGNLDIFLLTRDERKGHHRKTNYRGNRSKRTRQVFIFWSHIFIFWSLLFLFDRIEVLCHDINVHIPHHISPRIPSYNLRAAHQSLQENWGKVSWLGIFSNTVHFFLMTFKWGIIFSVWWGKQKTQERGQKMNITVSSWSLKSSSIAIDNIVFCSWHLTVPERGFMELASNEDNTDSMSCLW